MAEAAARARQVLGAKVDLEALVRGGRRLEREVERAVDVGRRVRKLGRREQAALRADVAEAGCLQGEVRVRVRVGLGQGFGFGFGLAAERFRVRVSVGRLQEWHDCTLAGELSDAVLHGKGGLGLAAHDGVVGHMPLVVGSRAIESREHHRRLRKERRSVRRGREREAHVQTTARREGRERGAVWVWAYPGREGERRESRCEHLLGRDGARGAFSASFGAHVTAGVALFQRTLNFSVSQ